MQILTATKQNNNTWKINDEIFINFPTLAKKYKVIAIKNAREFKVVLKQVIES